MGRDFRTELTNFQPRRGASQIEESIELQRILGTATLTDLVNIAKEIERDPDKLEVATKFGYQHANGFQKVTLFKNSACCLRAHIWGDGISKAENIHTHRWGFASRVLLGSVSESRFELLKTGDPMDEFGYVRDPSAAQGTLGYLRSVELAHTEEVIHEESTIYSMSTQQIHRINDKHGGRLVTLVLTGTVRSPRSLVYASSGQRPVEDSDQNALTVDGTRAALTRLVSLQ